MDPAGERVFARRSQPLLQAGADVAGLIQPLDLDPRVREAALVVWPDGGGDVPMEVLLDCRGLLPRPAIASPSGVALAGGGLFGRARRHGRSRISPPRGTGPSGSAEAAAWGRGATFPPMTGLSGVSRLTTASLPSLDRATNAAGYRSALGSGARGFDRRASGLGHAFGRSGIGERCGRTRIGWTQLIAGEAPKRLQDRARVVGCDHRGPRLCRDPSGLGSGSQGEDRPPGGEGLEKLEIQHLA